MEDMSWLMRIWARRALSAIVTFSQPVNSTQTSVRRFLSAHHNQLSKALFTCAETV
jgi:cob(I)alamin adenosyltransferase